MKADIIVIKKVLFRKTQIQKYSTNNKRVQIIQQLKMFGFLWKKPNKQFNLNNSYLVIEFLTQDQKIQKDKIIAKLDAQYSDNFDTIVPYSSSFRYSYRYTLYSSNIKNKILLAQVMALIEASNNQQFNNFYETNVNKIKLHMKNDKLVNAEDVIELYNERDISTYNPTQILEVIYEKRGLFDRLKVKTKKFAKNIPKYLFNILTKLASLLLNSIGLGSVNGVVSKFLPIRTIISWILNFLMVFFPPLAPLIGLTKLVI